MGVTNIDVTFPCLVNKKFTYHYFKYSKYVINWFYLLYFISESNLARAAGNLFWSCTSYQSIWIKIQTIVRVIFLFKFIGQIFLLSYIPLIKLTGNISTVGCWNSTHLLPSIQSRPRVWVLETLRNLIKGFTLGYFMFKILVGSASYSLWKETTSNRALAPFPPHSEATCTECGERLKTLWPPAYSRTHTYMIHRITCF